MSNPRLRPVIVVETNLFPDLVRSPKPGLNESNEPAEKTIFEIQKNIQGDKDSSSHRF